MKRSLSCLLAIILCFTMFPIQAFAVSDSELYTQYPQYLNNKEYNKIYDNTHDICQRIVKSQEGFHEFEAIVATIVDDGKKIAIDTVGSWLGWNASYEESIRESAVLKLLAAMSADQMSENEYTRNNALAAKKWLSVYADIAGPFESSTELSEFLSDFLISLGIDKKNASGLQNMLVKTFPDIYGSQASKGFQTALSLLALYAYRLDGVRILMESVNPDGGLYKDLERVLHQMENPSKYISENYVSKALLKAVEKWIENGVFGLKAIKEGSEVLNNASWVAELCKTLYFTFIYEGYKVDDYAEAVYLLGYATEISAARVNLLTSFYDGAATSEEIARYQQLYDLGILAQIAALRAYAGLLSVYNRYDLKMEAEDQAALLSWNHDYSWYIKQCRKCLEADLAAGKDVKRTTSNQTQSANSNTTVANNATEGTSKQSNVSASNVASEASALVGKYPYVWGGKSPSDGGFDCSGLIYYVYHNRLGYDMTYQQVWSRSVPGEKIESKSNLAAGDLIFGLNSSGGWHTGIYIGSNTMIHAGSSKGVSKTSINGTWFTFKFAIRPSALKQDTSTSVATTPTTPKAPQMTSSEIDGSWFVYVPANYKLVLYSSATSMSQASYCSPRDNSYRVVCSKKATLPNGTIRYYGVFNISDHYWLTYTNNMVVEEEGAKKIHTVNFNANGGSVSPNYKQVTAGGAYGDLPVPSRSGYTFDGWYTAASGGTQIISSTLVNLSSDQITLYAHWANTVSVDYAIETGLWDITIPANCPVTYYAGPTSMVVSHYEPGHSRAYRNVNFDTRAVLSDGTIRFSFTEDMWFTLTSAMSVENRNELKTYRVTLDPFVTCDPFQDSIDIDQGSSYGSLPTPIATADYLIFDGWYTEKTGGTRINSDTKLITDGNHTLYAHWTYRYIYVTFDPNGGSFMFSSDSKEHKYTGTEADMAWVIRAGYEFDGWYTEREGGRKITSINVGNGFQWDKSYTLYAHWIKEGQ